MKTTGIGLIGCGLWGSIHADTYSASTQVKLISVCDRNIDQANLFAQKHGTDQIVSDYHDVLKNPDVDAVAITTPDHTHTQIVIDALNAGKHVLVEKPLATTVEDCKRILNARDKAGKILMVDFHNRWNIPFIQVKNMFDSGELGDLQMINVRLNDTMYVPTQMLSWAANSSPVHFLGSHVVDLIRWLTGDEVNRAYAVSRSRVLREKGVDTPDFYQTILEFSSGTTAYVENCWILSENSPNVFEFKAELIGSKGSTNVNVSHHRMVEKYTDEGSGFPDVIGVVDRYGKAVGYCTAAIEHFLDCVVNNKPPMATGEDGLIATQIVQAIEQSSETGLPVDLEPVSLD